VITVPQLAKYLGVTKRAIRLNIERGKYPTAHRVSGSGNGRGGKIWLINIEDPGIPPEIRTQYYKDLAENQDKQNDENLAVPDGIKALAVSPMPVATSCISPGSQGQNGLPVPGCPPDKTEQDTSIDGIRPAADRGKVYLSGPSATPFGPPGHGESGKSLVPCGNHVEQVQISTMPAPAAFSEKAKEKAVARVDLVRAWREYRKNHQSRMEADREFQDGYNVGLIQKNLYDILGSTSIKTLRRWHRDLGCTSDWTRLVPLNLCKKQEDAQLSADEQKTFLNIILNPRKFRTGTAIRLTKTYLKNKSIPSDKSDRTFRRFAEKFKSTNHDIWIFMREGRKALRDKVEPFIKRDPSLLEVGDVLVADGHRLNFQIINPFTGKPCRAVLVGYLDWKSYDLAGFEVMIEENTQCIASALRNSIIRLGKFPKITYQDNGKAFRSRFFTSSESLEEIGIYGLFGRLGITSVFAQPYNARSKIIEGWFKNFSDTCERLMPSFTGASISDKPAWMLRDEKFHKALHGEYIPAIEEAKQIIDSWLTWHRSQSCPHVKNKTIGQVFEEGRGSGVDGSGLDDLMMAMRITKIGRNGIRFLNADYYDDNLYGLRESGAIKYSLFDLSYVKVYGLKGQYLCTAKRVIPVHPMANYLGDVKDVEALKQALAQQKRAERKTIYGAKELIKLGKPLALDWEGIIDARPQIVEKIEKENIILPETVERIPDEALRSTDKVSLSDNQLDDREEQQVSRPIFQNEIERYQWHLVNGFQDEDDMKFKEKFIQTDSYLLGFKYFENQDIRIKKDQEGAALAAQA